MKTKIVSASELARLGFSPRVHIGDASVAGSEEQKVQKFLEGHNKQIDKLYGKVKQVYALSSKIRVALETGDVETVATLRRRIGKVIKLIDRIDRVCASVLPG